MLRDMRLRCYKINIASCDLLEQSLLTLLPVKLLWKSHSVVYYASLHDSGFLETCKDNIRSAKKETVYWKHRDFLCSIDWK